MVCRIRSVSGHCFEIERLTTGQHSVAEKDGEVNCVYSGFQKSCSAEAVLVLINPVSLGAGSGTGRDYFHVVVFFTGMWAYGYG